MCRISLLLRVSCLFLQSPFIYAAALPTCKVDQINDSEISITLSEPTPKNAVKWIVDEVLTDNIGATTIFKIEPWDVNSHSVVAIDAEGIQLCQAIVTARTLPPDAPWLNNVSQVKPALIAPEEKGASTPESLQFDREMVIKPALGTQGGSIQGEVMLSSEEPLSHADVQLTNLETGVSHKTQTSSDGKYELRGLDAGKYKITVSQPGFSVWKLSDVFVGSTTPEAASTTPIRVYYATERELLAQPPILSFGASRSAADSILYGEAVVSVPKTHSGNLFNDSQYWSYNPKGYLASFSPLMKKEDFFMSVASQAAMNPTKKSILVFVHGFNNSFREDIYKTAQLAYDSQFAGVPVMFDWPATTPKIDLVGGYITDQGQIVSSISHLEDFLESLVGSSSGATINIVAHSMGNRLLLETLERMRIEHRLPQIGQLILAAPDIDVARFRAIVDPLLATKALSRVTLYGSSKDYAMVLSKKAHLGVPAVGMIPPLPNVSGIDIVDVSDLPMNIIGHDYFITTRSVLNDIGILLDAGTAPPRVGLSPLSQGSLHYWKLNVVQSH